MSVGGSGIPRLQDLSYLEVAATGVAEGSNFEGIRRALVSRAADLARDGDIDGEFDERKWETLRGDGTKYVHNTVDVLKELMRLGWLDRHILPSGPSSAYLHANETFTLTNAGLEWARLVREDRRGAYNLLIGELLNAHPQFEGFLRVVGARPSSSTTHLTIPLLKWDATRHSTEAGYLDDLIDYAVAGIESGNLAWETGRETVDSSVREYVRRIQTRLTARDKAQSRKQFVNSCDEAIVKVAFEAAGCRLDYISMELLRRWTRFLGLANFSYYAPGPHALRLWATATVTGSGSATTIQRRVGTDVRRAALAAIWDVWTNYNAAAGVGMYMPIWEMRAGVCWQERISDDEFDRALVETLGSAHHDLGFKLHLDQASVRATPASTRPLILPTTTGLRRIFNVVTVIPTKETP